MKATLTLMEEHRLIERVLTAMETGASRLEAGEDMRPAFWVNAAMFIQKYADGCHHHKEEGIYFKAMNAAGMPSTGGTPLAAMLADHEKGREFTAALKDAARAWEKGDTRARVAVAGNARGYVALLRLHIQKEDRILYPLAEKGVPAPLQEQVDADFETARQEEEAASTQEVYLALAEVLEKESTQKISS